MKRFLEIDVSRRVYSSVFVMVDDEHPEHSKIFAKPGEPNLGTIGATAFSRTAFRDAEEVASLAAHEILTNYDWEADFVEDSSIEIEAIREVDAKTILQYEAWNAEAEDFLVPEDVIDKVPEEVPYVADPNQQNLF